MMLVVALQSTAPVSSIVSSTAPPAKAGKVNAKGLICRKETLVGSRMPVRICVRPEELAERKQDDRDLLDKAQREQTIRTP